MRTFVRDVRPGAEEALKSFTTFTRKGEKRVHFKLVDDAPEWVRDMLFEVHGDMMPDDTKYEYVINALEAILNADEDEDVNDVREELEADVYNNDLLLWLSSHLTRYQYVDAAIEDYGVPDGGIMEAIRMGQLRERQEIFDVVVNALRERAEEIDEESEKEE